VLVEEASPALLPAADGPVGTPQPDQTEPPATQGGTGTGTTPRGEKP
jgi:hypothetical protein